MAYHLKQEIGRKLRSQRKHSWWRKAVTAMGAAVVFGTTYALILPAITLDRPYLCGQEEHTHDESCYRLPQTLLCQPEGEVLHSHEGLCFDEAGNLICTLPERLPHIHGQECYEVIPAHTHEEGCYTLEQTLTCGLEETLGHSHDDSCRGQEEVLICTHPEGHVHGEGCFETDTACLCPLEEHTHEEGCFDETGALICTQEEHTHQEICWETSQTLICQEPENHSHGPECFEVREIFLCGQEETPGHTHSDSCYTETKVLICSQQEGPEEICLACPLEEVHTHGPACFDESGVLICPAAELPTHQHGPECLGPAPEGEPELICTLPEHTHDDSCRTDPTAHLETPEIWEATLPGSRTGQWGEDILAVARSQLGYRESTLNLEFLEDGQVKGITRYGQWAGDPYGDWCGYFVDFCRHYAGVPAEAFPIHPGQSQWCDQLKEENWGIYWTPQEYTPEPGDRIYFDMDGNGAQDHVGLVEAFLPGEEGQPDRVRTIEGNAANQVQQLTYEAAAPEILGYASVAAARERYDRLHAPEVPTQPEYLCGKEEHTHGEVCLDESGSLICTLEEHTHTEACLLPPSPEYLCGKEEHTHGKVCLDESGSLICTQEAHTHTEACLLPPAPEYLCGKEEHTHSEGCLDESGSLICTLEEHSHTEACLLPPAPEYICGQEAHLHEGSCYDDAGNLVCGKTEHIHDDRCLGYLCGQIGHSHGPACYEGETLLCPLAEHTHTQRCKTLLTGAVFRQVRSLAELSGEESYLLVSQDPQTGESRLLSARGVETISLEAGVDETGSPAAELSLEGRSLSPQEPEALGEENLWQAQEDEVLESLQDETLHLRLTQTQPEQFQIQPQSEINFGTLELEEAPPAENVMLFAAAGVESVDVPTCDSENCPLSKRLDWTESNEMNVFGGAHRYTLFLLENMDTFGVVHGNAAIGGSITGNNEGFTYDDESNMDFSGNETPHFEVGLLLGGDAMNVGDGNKEIIVKNGSVISQYPYSASKGETVSGVQMDREDEDHYHQDGGEKISTFFSNAQTDLLARNSTIYDFAKNEVGASHRGEVRYLTDDDFYTHTNQGEVGKDVILLGTDHSFNVFNVDATYLTAESKHEREVYLVVPFGSYTMINVVADEAVADGVLENFAPKLRYRDSTGKFIDQPADKSKNDDYIQTQRTLMNFAPSITKVTVENKGGFVYAAVLAPNVELEIADNAALTIQGNTVLKKIHCLGKQNESAIIYNPYQIPGQANFNKFLICDDHALVDGKEQCPICQMNEGNSEVVESQNATRPTNSLWDNYRVDVTLESVDEVGGSKREYYVKGLRLDGTPQERMETMILAPGLYRVKKEEIYKLGENEEKIPVDTATEWPGHKFRNANFLESAWVTPTPDTPGYENFLRITANVQEFETIVNHYTLGDTQSVLAAKKWYATITNASGDQQEILISPPSGANCVFTLYKKDANGKEIEVEDVEPITVSEATHWMAQWTGLPELAEGETYVVKEPRGWDGYEQWGEPEQNPDTGVWTIKNRRRKIEAETVEVIKHWYDEQGDLIPGNSEALKDLTATLQLYRQTGRYPDEGQIDRPYKVTIRLGESEHAPIYEIPVARGSTLNLNLQFWASAMFDEALNAQSAVGIQNFTETGSQDQAQLDENGDGTVEGTSKVVYSHTITGTIAHITKNLEIVLEINPDRGVTIVDQNVKGKLWGKAEVELLPLDDKSEEQLSDSQLIWGDELETVPIENSKVTLPVSESKGRWSYQWTNLPAQGNEDGKTVKYRYYVLETETSGGQFQVDYTILGKNYTKVTLDNAHKKLPGISNGGFVHVNNRQIPTGPELPATGGGGSGRYTLGGLALALTALLGMAKHRKEDK